MAGVVALVEALYADYGIIFVHAFQALESEHSSLQNFPAQVARTLDLLIAKILCQVESFKAILDRFLSSGKKVFNEVHTIGRSALCNENQLLPVGRVSSLQKRRHRVLFVH